MNAFYSIQINSDRIPPEGLQGQLGLSIVGTLRPTPIIYIENDVTVFHQSRITIRPLLPDVGIIENLELSYISQFPSQRWYLKSVEIIEEKRAKYYYFPFGSWIQSQLVSQAGTAKSPIRHGKFKVFRGKNRQYYFHLIAPNGEIIASSEGYKSRAGAMNGIRSIKDNATSAVVVNN
ncbi:MAG: DUF1508 domain-containing protein [Nitrospina sp.]|jgi:uncharacterized protein|nr:DUF1508 domain-containing protein [Nitrospina sp.]